MAARTPRSSLGWSSVARYVASERRFFGVGERRTWPSEGRSREKVSERKRAKAVEAERRRPKGGEGRAKAEKAVEAERRRPKGGEGRTEKVSQSRRPDHGGSIIGERMTGTHLWEKVWKGGQSCGRGVRAVESTCGERESCGNRKRGGVISGMNMAISGMSMVISGMSLAISGMRAHALVVESFGEPRRPL